MRLLAAAIFLFATALPLSAFADNCDGLTIAVVRFLGCGKARCRDRQLQERLARLTDLPGAIYTKEGVSKGVARLLKTGYFRSVEAECHALSRTDARVDMRVVPNRFVRRTRIEGAISLFTSDLEKRIFINKGAVFNPDQKKSKEQLERQLAALRSYVREQGFEAGEVEARTELVEPDMVDLVFIVKEGKVTRVESVSVEIEFPEQQDVPVQYSCPLFTRRDVMSVIGVERGDLVTGRTSQVVKKKLRFFLQKHGYLSPRVVVKFDSKTGELFVGVKVTSCFSVLVYERDEPRPFQEGYEQTGDESLLDVLPFKESGVFNEREAQLGIEELTGYYRNRGYLFAQVELQFVDYREMFPGWPYPLIGGAIYRVTKGYVTEIREIRFLGNRAFSDEKLASLMETRVYNFFDTGGYLQVERFFADLDVIKKHYHDHGYFAMDYPLADKTADRIRTHVMRRGDFTIWRYQFLDKAFDVVKPDWESSVRLEVTIDEGPCSRLGAVDIKGAKVISVEDLAQALPAVRGAPFSPRIVATSKAIIERKYQELGRFVKVEVRCRGRSPDVRWEDCRIDDLRSLDVDLVFEITEGVRHIMGEIIEVGNYDTARNVITRDFPREGELFDKSRVDEAVRKLRNLGIFSAVRVVTIGPDESPPREKVAVVVQVEEGPTRFVELSGGFQKMINREGHGPGGESLMHPTAASVVSNSLHVTGAPLSGAASSPPILFPDVLLLGEFSYTDKNLFGHAKDLFLPLSYGLTTTDPARYAAFKPTYLDTRFLSSDITLRLTPLIVYDRALSVFDKFEYGGENEFTYTLRKRIYLSLLTRSTMIRWKYPSESDYKPQEFQVSASPQIRFDWRDNPINPFSGYLFSARVTYLNALEDVQLKYDQDTGVLIHQARQRENFLKYELQAQGYLSLRKTVVLAINARFGDSRSLTLEETDLPPNQKFYLGGTNGVRGFPARGILQYDSKGNPITKGQRVLADGRVVATNVEGGDTMLNANVELRFPILRSSGFWGAAFLDSGALSDGLENLHVASLRFSAGFGIRWLIGDQIPLRLDYGFVINPRCNQLDVEGNCLSTDPPGALDFGLLYTF